MSDSQLVRASRDGDQFHYLWAARRCLRLLLPQSGLVAITIEGASPHEDESGSGTSSQADAIIDLAEYYGSEHLKDASHVRYMQLKHSTFQVDKHWVPSELARTLEGFVNKHKEVQVTLSKTDLSGIIEFWFVTNRPIAEGIKAAIEDAASGQPARYPADLVKLEAITGYSKEALRDFCNLLRFDDRQDSFWEQRNALAQDVSGYLPDSDIDAPVQLKELVTQKATTQFLTNPTITKYDVLRAFKADETSLFPAHSLIERPTVFVEREQSPSLIDAIVGTEGRPIIIHAEGGVGKSIFATSIADKLSKGSAAILYDCFGNGQYRNTSHFRHRHKDGMPQIANELSGQQGLCHPLIPTPHADASSYIRAFVYRLGQAITSLRAAQPNALLCIIIDAADNAQIAAEENGEPRSFARDLIRAALPEGVRLVCLCRTHRQYMLDPPTNVLSLELKLFSREETARLLRQSFPDATDFDISEFHRLSTQNPRVQSLALSRGNDLQTTLRLLGPNPTTAENTIRQILDAAIAALKDAASNVEKKQIDRICAGLAALRPLIPISVLAAIAGVSESAVRSFALDIGRPLRVTDNTIQFFDEPAETWFRETFRPEKNALAEFIGVLKPLASGSAYVASVLPQLMLQAYLFTELVQLALSNDALPQGSPLEKRDVELQRLQFALKASLRAKRFLEAAKLSLKAGGETAGEDRQNSLIQSNTDLAAIFLDNETIQEIVSRRTFGSGWVGSHHAYEAGLLSGKADLAPDARSRLRMAEEWLRNWSGLPANDRKKEEMSFADIAEMAYAHLSVHGAARASDSLTGWRPNDVAYRAGAILAGRLIDLGRFADLDQIATTASDNLCLALAITSELRRVGRLPPKKVIAQVFRKLSKKTISVQDTHHWDAAERPIGVILPLVEAAICHKVCEHATAAALLSRYLPNEPPRGLASPHGGSRFTYLRGYCLRAALLGNEVSENELAYPELRKKLEEKRSYSSSQEESEFKENVGALLPWHKLWAEVFLGTLAPAEVANALTNARTESSKSRGTYYSERSDSLDEIARLWISILDVSGTIDSTTLAAIDAWRGTAKRELFTPTLRFFTSILSRYPPLHAKALDYAKIAYDLTRGERGDAAGKASDYLNISRTVLVISRSEAQAYFNEAVAVSNKIGDENLDRWASLLDLADRAADPTRPAPEAAYRFSRCAELTYDYVARDKHFHWNATVRALGGLCPTSAFAILSRWRDRHFGLQSRILPELVQSLVETKYLSASDALVLLGVRGDWNEPALLEAALKGNSDKSSAVHFVYRKMLFSGKSLNAWTALKAITDAYAIPLPDLDDRIAATKAELAAVEERKRNEEFAVALEDKNKIDWDVVFAGLTLVSADEILKALERFKANPPSWYHEKFFAEVFRRVPAGARAEFVRAFADVPEFDLYYLRNFLEQFPDDWKSSLAVKAALAETVNIFARRYCLEITKNRYYEVLPFTLITQLSGVSEADLMRTILSAVGEHAEVVGAGRLFTLVGIIAELLTHDEALDALMFGMQLLEPVLEDKDGDGPWSPSLAPAGDMADAMAGYIWAGLASPDSAVRWEAAHCVVAICKLRRDDILARLIEWAKKRTATPFVDLKLAYYELHSRLWFCIALARGSKECPEILRPHFEFISSMALDSDGHVLIRQYAAEAALAVLAHDSSVGDATEKAALEAVNVSPFAIRDGEEHDVRDTDDSEPTEDDRYFFGIDIGPYWYAPLARCFGVSQQRVEREAIKIIRGGLGFQGGSRWDEDERARRGYFRDGESYGHQSSYPKIDRQRFYLCYHAMLFVAGKLLATLPILRSRYSSQDEFKEWLARHSITRTDGYWLADRRDPTPLERQKWKDEKENDDWRWSVQKGDFDSSLEPTESQFNLWGDWVNLEGRQEEHVHVTSALVGRERADALLRALQTTKNPHDYRIPSADDELEIDHNPYILKGWVESLRRDRELDGFDPWAGQISFPAPRPAGPIVKALNLSTDENQRRWSSDNKGSFVDATVWGHFTERRGDENPERGSRLQATGEFVVELLAKTGMSLIVKVEIRRTRTYRQYDAESNNGFDYILQSARLFLIGPEGSYVSL